MRQTRHAVLTLLLTGFVAIHGAAAQETATEREAARDVLARLATLERSLDVPALVTRLTAANPAREQVVARARQLMRQELLALSDDLCTHPEIGYEESGSVSRDIPGIGFSAYTSDWPNHTYEMDQDNLKPVGHTGFTVQAQAMTAVLFDFATRPDFRAAVTQEFGTIRGLFGDYLAALDKVYAAPSVAEPK